MKNETDRSDPMVVLSLDGMRPDFYRRTDGYGLEIPHLRKLVEAGASADRAFAGSVGALKGHSGYVQLP